MKPQFPTPTNIALLISGGGRTAINIAEYISTGNLDATIKIIIASTPHAKGIIRCKDAQLPTKVINHNEFQTTAQYSSALFDVVRKYQCDLVCFAGFLKLLEIPDDYENRCINIHPALLPKFGGKGMYGSRVHKAVLAAGETESGCTIHFADNIYDHGGIIHQSKISIDPDETPDTLAAKVFEQECNAYPEAIRILQQT